MTTKVNTPSGGSSSTYRLWIGGHAQDAISGRFEPVIDPSVEDPIGEVAWAEAPDVDRAVTAALEAFAAWRRVPPRDRGRQVRSLAAILREHQEELARLDAVDGGFPVVNMRNDVLWAAELLELFADWAMELKGDTIPASAEHLHFTQREPFGVVGRIVPFNHPIFFAAGKVAAPLVAGNTVVLKPAEQTPLSALRFAELASEVLPPGVLNIVTGGREAGDALVRHPQVRRLAFIGSDAVGRAIQRGAAEAGVKDVTLELGGKNAMIVFPDADLDAAAQGVVAGMNFIGSAGQSCGSNSRLLVHHDIAEDLTQRVVARVEQLQLGLPLDETTQVGPLVSGAQRERTEQFVAAARDDGAILRTGGRRPAGMERGFYYEPTVFSGVQPQSTLGQQEVFGPILAVMAFDEADEAVKVANDVDYGLTASVWTSDLTLAHRTVRDLEAGYIWINGSSRHFWGVPFGGTKSSGVGREESIEELLSFTHTKAVHVLLD